jgi:ketosteroid isomerase-like protein
VYGPDHAKEITMTENQSPALATALAYYRAWTGNDFDQAMTHVADDVVCDAPAGRVEGAEAFRGFMGPFAQIVTESHLIAAFGDEATALLMYDTRTVPVESAPGAECHTVRDGKIAHIRLVFDRAPFEAARRSQSG